MRLTVFQRWLVLFIFVPLVLSMVALTGSLYMIGGSYTDQSAAARIGWLAYKPELIFAGDSRAERGFDPTVAEREMGWLPGKAVNIALGGADPVQLLQVVRTYPEQFDRSTLILSVSPFMVNDGIKQGAYYSRAMMANTEPFELMVEFLTDNPSMLLNYVTEETHQLLFGRPEVRQLPNLRISTQYRLEFSEERYHAISELFNGGMPHLGRGWYVDWRTDGPRKQVLERALTELKQRVGLLAVVHGPYAPTYLEAADGVGVPDAESIREFDRIMRDIAERVGFAYHSYAFTDGWTDGEFYDTSHLNKHGAAVFTERVMKDFHLYE